MPVLHLDSLIHHIERDTYTAPAGEPPYNACREPSINRVDTTTLALTITAPPTRIANRGVDTGSISAWTE